MSCAPTASEPPPRYLYVGVPGSDLDTVNVGVSILVFDIGHDHQFVKRIAIWPRGATPERIRGLELAPPSASARAGAPRRPRLYISTTRRLGAIDLASGNVLWEQAYRGHCCDQMAASPDGRIIYAPAFGSPEWYVIDPAGGALVSTVHVIGWPRSTAFSRNGKLAYLAAWESNRLSVADTASNTITSRDWSLQWVSVPIHDQPQRHAWSSPISMGSSGLRSVTSRPASSSIASRSTATRPTQLAQYECPSHGLAFTPDERELWVADGVDNRLRIFDATTYPPVEKSSIQLTRQPRSITFSRDGRFAYASTGDVLDVATKRIVAALKDEQGKVVESEHMVEVEMPSTAPLATVKR